MSFSMNHPSDGSVAWSSAVDGNWTTLENELTEYSCAVYNSTTQALSANTDTALSFDSELYNNGAIHSTTTNKSRITVSVSGRYLFWANVVTDSSGQNLQQWFRINGSAVTGYVHSQLSTGERFDFGLTVVLNLNANDYVEIVVNSQTACNVSSGSGSGGTLYGATRLA